MQRYSARVLAVLALVGSLSATSAPAADCPTYDVNSAADVPSAVAGVRAVLECQGFTIIAVINHGAAAASVGLVLRPTQLIIFSDPRTDWNSMRWRRGAGIDVPQKLLVYEDTGATVRLHTNASSYVADRHGIPIFDPAIAHTRRTLGQFGSDLGMVVAEGTQSVAATVAALRAAIQAAGFNSLLIDHSAIAASAGLSLPPTQLVIFGNPRVGTLLMQNEHSIGIDLPLKILVWHVGHDPTAVRIAYNDPYYIARRHNVTDMDAVLTGIANTLKNLVTAAGGQ